MSTPVPIPLDDEILGGCVDYATIIESDRHLKDELEGFTTHCEPMSPPLLLGLVQLKPTLE